MREALSICNLPDGGSGGKAGRLRVVGDGHGPDSISLTAAERSGSNPEARSGRRFTRASTFWPRDWGQDEYKRCLNTFCMVVSEREGRLMESGAQTRTKDHVEGLKALFASVLHVHKA